MNRMYQAFYYVGWPFFSLFHPVKTIGRENIPQGGALVCANHSAYSDPLLAVVAFGRKRQLHIMAKAAVMRYPILGPLLKKSGIFGIERGKADFTAMKTAINYLRDGEYVFIFPEGTRVRGNEDVEAKKGAIMLAVRTGAPVVPMYIPTKKPFFRFKTVIIGQPYHPDNGGKRPTAEDYHRMAEELMDKIYALGGNVDKR